jgi:Transposase domain (DUF772)
MFRTIGDQLSLCRCRTRSCGCQRNWPGSMRRWMIRRSSPRSRHTPTRRSAGRRRRECYLRLMFLRFRYRLGFESLCAEVSDSITWRRICRIPLGRVPHPTTLMKLTTRCGMAAVQRCNEALLAKAAGAKLVRTSRRRVGTTVGERVLPDRFGSAGEGDPPDRSDRPADPGRGGATRPRVRRRGRFRRADNDPAELLKITRQIASQTRERLAGVTPDGASRRGQPARRRRPGRSPRVGSAGPSSSVTGLRSPITTTASSSTTSWSRVTPPTPRNSPRYPQGHPARRQEAAHRHR